jgi:hypothetical protein
LFGVVLGGGFLVGSVSVFCFLAFGDLFFAPLFLLVSPAERDDFAFCAPLFFPPFHGRRRELFYFFAPFLRFLRLHSKRVLLFVVFFAFGDFIFAPIFFTLVQQACFVFCGDFGVIFCSFFAPLYFFFLFTAEP